MHFVNSKGLLSAGNGMNLYRGCTHGCIYCDSRSTCYQMDHDFEDIEVKQNAPELLENALRRKRKKCMVGTGAMCDPYMPCEEQLKLWCDGPDKIRPGTPRPGPAGQHQPAVQGGGADDTDHL